MLAVAVGLGAYLIDLGAAGHVAASSGTTTTTTTTTTTSTTTAGAPPKSTTTTTTTLPAGAQPSQSVKVLVANGSQTTGAATYYSKKLATAGWGTLTPVTATTAFPSSIVYFASGEQRAARSVAATLGVPSSAVQSLTPTVAVPATTGADVVVVVGDDLAAKVPAGSG